MKYIYTLLFIFATAATFLKADYWEEVTDITPHDFINTYWLDVYFLPSNLNYGWVCGRDARVIRTTDRGKTWRGVTLPSTEHLESIHFTTKNIGYVSGVDGIWKSEDGGVNWTNITPSDTVSYWGCYFWDSNNGVVIGDGCMIYHQYFWHTTNGGTTWTQFEGDQPNSGLTDAIIINPNTEAYAVSSGRLWISSDGGRTWDVKDTTGTTVWHEEISKYANSFLIPTSGDVCSGGGTKGGMRFSTNGGATWTERQSPRGPMYGTFLINQSKGWACGLYGQVLYTDDAGQSWKEMDCGLDGSHLDDIRFLSEDEGWVVGQGLYRLANNTYEISENPIIFPDMCLPGYVDKTIYISNKSFDSNIAELNIIGLDKDDFTLMMPNNTFTMKSCDEYPVTIRFEPSTLGEKNAILRCEFTGAVMYEIPIQAFALEPSLVIDSTNIVINPAYCGYDNTGYLELLSVTKKDTIESFNKKNGSTDIDLITKTPIGINIGAALTFSANPRDTGWVEAQYLLHLKPCENDTVLTVRAYGVSPIIQAPLQVQQVIACTNTGEMLVPIANTGNADLYVSDIEFVKGNPNFTYRGTKTGNNIPLRIVPGASDTLIIELTPQDFGMHKETLHIINNDSTRSRGQKNPHIVELQYEFSTPLPEILVQELDFGRLCLDETKTLSFMFYNRGNIELTLAELFFVEDIFEVDLETHQNETINSQDSVEIKIDFTALTIGSKSDTLKIVANPCSDTLYVVLKAQVETAALRANPDEITLNLQTGENSNDKINLKSYSTVNLEITGVSLVPPNSDIELQYPGGFPQSLEPGKSIDIDYIVKALKDLSYEGLLCIETDGFCDADTCIPITIESFSGKIALSTNDLDFGYYTCDPLLIEKSIKIKNESDYPDTLTKIEISPAGDFVINNLPQLPYYMTPGDEIEIDMVFDIQKEGLFEADFIISTFLLQGRDITVPLKIEYRTPVITTSDLNHDFGVLEVCDNIRTASFKIYNNGTLADTLKYSDKNVLGFSNDLETDLIIAPGEDTTIVVTFEPALAKQLGKHTYEINLQSKVCDLDIKYLAGVEIIAPRLTYAPTSMDLGRVWKDFSKDSVIVIHNNSPRDREIIKLEFEPPLSGLTYDFEVPKLIPAGKSDTIYINFIADQVGSHTSRMFLEDKSVCLDKTYIDFSVNVPDEYYRIDLSTGIYDFDVADKGTLEIFLENAVPKFYPESVELALSYNVELFYPSQSFMHIGEEKTEITLIADESGFRIKTEGKNIDSLFQQDGVIFTIEGQPLASFPRTSLLEIKDVQMGTSKIYDLHKELGSITVQGFCEAIVNNGLMTLPNLKAEVTNSINSDYININIESDEPQYAEIYLYDLSGSITKARIYVDKEAVYKISTSNMSQGVYFISLSTEWGKHVGSSKILILK